MLNMKISESPSVDKLVYATAGLIIGLMIGLGVGIHYMIASFESFLKLM